MNSNGHYCLVYPTLTCPHCRATGQVHTQAIRRGEGAAGGNMAGRLLTSGTSLHATGGSQGEAVQQTNCGNCGWVWFF